MINFVLSLAGVFLLVWGYRHGLPAVEIKDFVGLFDALTAAILGMLLLGAGQGAEILERLRSIENGISEGKVADDLGPPARRSKWRSFVDEIVRVYRPAFYKVIGFIILYFTEPG